MTTKATELPVPAAPSENDYLKAGELVDVEPPYVFNITRVGEGSTQFGPKWFLTVDGPDPAQEYVISFKQGDDDRDAVLKPLCEQKGGLDVKASLYRTGKGGRTITVGAPKADAVPFAKAQVDSGAPAAGSDDDDIPF
jgi:hypothetical protein